jgi:hypothetical protein
MGAYRVVWSRKQNVAIVISAAIVALWIFYVVKNPEIFVASVLSLQEKTFIAEKWRDIAYKTNSWVVDIFISKQLETPTNIDFTIIFDSDTVTIDTQNLSGQGTRSADMPDKESLIIHTIPKQNIDKTQSLIMIPFTWNYDQIVLSEAVTKLNNNTEKNLSIGSLNEVNSHSK